MKRTVLIWAAFACLTAVVLAAMGWITWTALRLESEQVEAQQKAILEENVRLALWRMDSALMPLIGRESARSPEAYRPLIPTSGAAASLDRPLEQPVLVPSRLLSNPSPYILCHFQFAPDSELTSPQVPMEKNREALPSEIESAPIVPAGAAERLEELSRFADREKVLACLPAPDSPSEESVPDGGSIQSGYGVENRTLDASGNGGRTGEPAAPQTSAQVESNPGVRQIERRQQMLNFNEYQSRARNTMNVNGALLLQPGSSDDPSFSARRDVQVGALAPLWMDGRLLLARRADIDGEVYVQGMWLDWSGVRDSLLRDVADLLPNADLKPVRPTASADESRMLTTIPARVVPGRLAMEVDTGMSPTGISLLVAWSCTLLAAVMGSVLLYGVLALSERRATFVSAVTHELRTPLTTFQLYTELLDEGLVGAEQQKEYVKTLRAESGRLGHLVENVLHYARLNRRPGAVQAEEISATELLEPIRDRLAERARQAEMRLEVDSRLPDPPVVKADASAVERILFNLVDNACKYAAGAEDRRIELHCRREGSCVAVRVRDHGPGVDEQTRRRLFRPFSKSAREAARSMAGIGLGLALGRELARKLQGDLRHEPGLGRGACFVLTLPVVDAGRRGKTGKRWT